MLASAAPHTSRGGMHGSVTLDRLLRPFAINLDALSLKKPVTKLGCELSASSFVVNVT